MVKLYGIHSILHDNKPYFVSHNA